MDCRQLKAKMADRGMTVKALCECIGISRPAWYRKINGLSDFTRREIKMTAEALRLTMEELVDIFFANEVSYTKPKKV